MKSRLLYVLVPLLSLVLSGCGASNLSSFHSGSTQESSASSIDSSEPSSESSEERTYANGAYDFRHAGIEERTEILGALEKYAIDTKLAGMTLFDDGGYDMYSPAIVKGSDRHILDYGFGILEEGSVKEDLAGETNQAWKRYFHSYKDREEEPTFLNQMKPRYHSSADDLITYTSGVYFRKFMNAAKNGFDWVGDLSPLDRPIAVDPDDSGLAYSFLIKVKTGDDLKYSTLSTKYAKYNNRAVSLGDYITPFKILYTQAYGMARSKANLTGKQSLQGTAAYYDGSKEGFNEELWAHVGIKTVEETSSIQFTFNEKTTCFDAMLYLTDHHMFAPVPEEFITDIGGGDFATGVSRWGDFSDGGESIIDHWLSTGPYMLERWDKQQRIVFKKNPNYGDDAHYKIEGIHVSLLDLNSVIDEFLADRIHAVYSLNDMNIYSKETFATYIDDPRTVMTSSSFTYRVSFNTCTQDFWESLFGENGSVRHTPTSDYWECEPAMANKDFLDGMSFAIDRVSLAKRYGKRPSIDFFGDTFMAASESGVSYNKSQAHKGAIESIADGTDGYGYSLEKAKASFRKSSDALIQEGIYKAGDTIEIEVVDCYQNTDKSLFLSDACEMVCEAFNTEENPLRLKFSRWSGGQSWTDGYYKKMMLGQFDMGFGAISPSVSYSLLETIKSDNSSGFTLNWGVDTNAVDHAINWDGVYWSFDALWTAAERGAYVENGENAELFTADFEHASVEMNPDGSATLSFKVREINIGDNEKTATVGLFDSACIYGYSEADYSDYAESYVTREQEGCEVIPLFDDPFWSAQVNVAFDAETVARFNQYVLALGFDIYCAKSLLGSPLSVKYAGSIELRPGSLVPAGNN